MLTNNRQQVIDTISWKSSSRFAEKELYLGVPAGRWLRMLLEESMIGEEEEEECFEEAGTPLSSIADAFEELAESLRSGSRQLRLDDFCAACSLVPVLFSCLGLAFKFAEMEYVHKVHQLVEASKIYDTLPRILDHDVARHTVKKPGSPSRNLRRVRLGLDLIRALFEQFLSSDAGVLLVAFELILFQPRGYEILKSAGLVTAIITNVLCLLFHQIIFIIVIVFSSLPLREAASTAYTQVCAPYHTWAIRKAVCAGMYTLPTRDQLLVKLNETDHSVQREMKRYIDASSPIIQYIDSLYMQKDIVLDW